MTGDRLLRSLRLPARACTALGSPMYGPIYGQPRDRIADDAGAGAGGGLLIPAHRFHLPRDLFELDCSAGRTCAPTTTGTAIRADCAARPTHR